jgi:ATP-dependent Clp protease ATP-binding subunit ClpA
MFERLTDLARRVLVLAQEEARLLGHDFIGTEHLLLGMVKEPHGIAAQVLMERGITTGRARIQIEQIVGKSTGQPTGSPPFTTRAKRILELSMRAALHNKHDAIGPEHILLGLVEEGEGVGAQVIRSLGVELDDVREAVLRAISGDDPWPDGDFPDVAPAPWCTGCAAELEASIRYRTLSVPPASPDMPTMMAEVVFCGDCGKVVSVFR